MLEPLSLHWGVDGQQQAEAAVWDSDWDFCAWKGRGEGCTDEEGVILKSEGCHHLRLLQQWCSLSCASRTFPLCLC